MMALLDRQADADAGAAAVSGAGCVGAVEAFEDAAELLGGDAVAVVADGEGGFGAGA